MSSLLNLQIHGQHLTPFSSLQNDFRNFTRLYEERVVQGMTTFFLSIYIYFSKEQP